MRLLCAVLVTFTAYCCSLVEAYNLVKLENSKRGIMSSINKRLRHNERLKLRHKGSITTTISVVGEERAFNTLKPQMQTFLQSIKTMIEKHPIHVKAKEMVDKDIRLKGALLIGRSQVKAVAIVAVSALVGGFFMHLIKD